MITNIIPTEKPLLDEGTHFVIPKISIDNNCIYFLHNDRRTIKVYDIKLGNLKDEIIIEKSIQDIKTFKDNLYIEYRDVEYPVRVINNKIAIKEFKHNVTIADLFIGASNDTIYYIRYNKIRKFCGDKYAEIYIDDVIIHTVITDKNIYALSYLSLSTTIYIWNSTINKINVDIRINRMFVCNDNLYGFANKKVYHICTETGQTTYICNLNFDFIHEIEVRSGKLYTILMDGKVYVSEITY
jgi:hypothetical protein